MNFDQRRRFILAYLRSHNEHVSIVNADFVLSYIEAAKPAFAIMPYGAHKCPALGRDLARMQREGSLQRKRVGIRDMAGQGIPEVGLLLRIDRSHKIIHSRSLFA